MERRKFLLATSSIALAGCIGSDDVDDDPELNDDQDNSSDDDRDDQEDTPEPALSDSADIVSGRTNIGDGLFVKRPTVSAYREIEYYVEETDSVETLTLEDFILYSVYMSFEYQGRLDVPAEKVEPPRIITRSRYDPIRRLPGGVALSDTMTGELSSTTIYEENTLLWDPLHSAYLIPDSQVPRYVEIEGGKGVFAWRLD